MAFTQWGDTINSPGNWDQSEEIQRLMALRGQKLGDWQTDPDTGIRYIDTPYGRVQNANQLLYNPNVEEGSTAYVDPKKTQGLVSARHANEHGSDAVRGQINDKGIVTRMGMDRESEKDRNLAILGIAGLGAAAYLGAGAAASGAGSSAAGGGASAAGSGGLVGGSNAAITGTTAAGEYGLESTAVSAGLGNTAGSANATLAQQALNSAGLSNVGTAAGLGGGAGGGAAGGGMQGAGSWFSSLFGNGRVWGNTIAGLAQGYLSRNKGEDKMALQNDAQEHDFAMLERRNALEQAMIQKQNEWRARNFGPGMAATVKW